RSRRWAHDRLLGQRQIEHEGAARSGDALDRDLAAEQCRQLAADGQPEAGAAEATTGRAVRLLERLEDDLLLVRGNADAGVRDDEGDHLRGRSEERRVGKEG